MQFYDDLECCFFCPKKCKAYCWDPLPWLFFNFGTIHSLYHLQWLQGSTDVCAASVATWSPQLVPTHREVWHYPAKIATTGAVRRWTPGRGCLSLHLLLCSVSLIADRKGGGWDKISLMPWSQREGSGDYWVISRLCRVSSIEFEPTLITCLHDVIWGGGGGAWIFAVSLIEEHSTTMSMEISTLFGTVVIQNLISMDAKFSF